MPRSFRIRFMVRIRNREVLQRQPHGLPSGRARSITYFVRRLMLARSMAATPAMARATSCPPAAAPCASSGISSAFRSTPMMSSRLSSSKRPSVSLPSRSSAVTTVAFPVCIAVRRPFRPGFWNTVPVMVSWWIWAGVDARAGEAHPLVLQGVGSVVPATGNPGVTVGRHCLIQRVG